MIPDFTNISILIVEDDLASMLLFKEILEPTHARLYYASNVEELMDSLQYSEIQLVLLDIQFCGTTGIALLPLIKEKLPLAAIIAQTAFIYNFDSHIFKNNGFDAYIQKPIHMKDLIKLIVSVLNRKK